MEKSTKPLLVLIAVGIAVIIVQGFMLAPAQQQAAGALPGQALGTLLNSASSSVTTGSSECVAANSNRAAGEYINDSGNTIYLKLGTGSAVAGAGIRLNANGGSFSIDAANRWVGPIQCITSTGTSTLSYIEYK